MEPSRTDMRLSALVGLVSAGLLSAFASADVSSLDAGELGGAATLLGVPHPNGFALDMLLLRAASLWPFGSLAFRQNVSVGLIAAAAFSCIAYACMRLSRQCGWSSPPAAASAAGACAAVLLSSRTLLDCTLAVEVYATSLLCVALAGLLADAAHKATRRAVWPLAGLALGAHVTAPLLVAPLAIAAWLRKSGRSQPVLWCTAMAAACCALLLCYLPLASLRNTAFDWGDPETLGRWLRHLSAARIREAYAGALFTPDTQPRLRLVEQLSEQPLFLLAALLGVIGVLRQQPQRLLAIAALLSLDLGYAVWINPMGIAQRQVGHASTALIALLAGCGCALVVESLRARLRYAAPLTAALTVSAGMWCVGRALSESTVSDGYAVSERYGAASPLSELPPHAVYICESDSACASALFAVYAEGTRPDLDVVPAQHLWDPSVLRRLRGLPLVATADSALWPEPGQRAAWAERRQRSLLEQVNMRPVFVERVEHVADAVAARTVDLSCLPYLGLSERHSQHVVTQSDRLASLERARFGASGPQTPLARELWASAHETLGSLYLRTDRGPQAVAELSRTVALTPLRAAARSNLGVALERRGDLSAALDQTAHAVQLDPLRPTPWVNMTRLLLRLHGPEAARAALLNASRYAVHDPRLDELTRQIDTRPNAAQGTTR